MKKSQSEKSKKKNARKITEKKIKGKNRAKISGKNLDIKKPLAGQCLFYQSTILTKGEVC
mgnify:CR=1 FL=1